MAVAVATVIGAASCQSADPNGRDAVRLSSEKAHDVMVDRDVVYTRARTEVGEVELAADVYRPDGPGPFSGLIFQHGGGFQSGRRDDANVARFAREMAARGLVVASISYRLISDRPVLTELRAAGRSGAEVERRLAVGAAAATEDLLEALEWFGGEASTYRVAPHRIFVGGSSAGATAAMIAAYSADDLGAPPSRPVAGVVDLWGAYGFATAPVDDIEAGDPPLFLVHGTEDRVVPLAWVQPIIRQVRALDLPAEITLVHGAGHGWTATGVFKARRDDGGPPILERLVRFLNRV